jgi:hypothetical protein
MTNEYDREVTQCFREIGYQGSCQWDSFRIGLRHGMQGETADFKRFLADIEMWDYPVYNPAEIGEFYLINEYMAGHAIGMQKARQRGGSPGKPQDSSVA